MTAKSQTDKRPWIFKAANDKSGRRQVSNQAGRPRLFVRFDFRRARAICPTAFVPLKIFMTPWNLNRGVYRLPYFSGIIRASFEGFHPADDAYYSTLFFSTRGGSIFGGQSCFIFYSLSLCVYRNDKDWLICKQSGLNKTRTRRSGGNGSCLRSALRSTRSASGSFLSDEAGGARFTSRSCNSHPP